MLLGSASLALVAAGTLAIEALAAPLHLPLDVESPWAATAVRAEIAGLAAGSRWADRRGVRGAVAGFYAARGHQPAFLVGGRPTPQALALVEVLLAADSRGLSPSDYDAAPLAGRVADLSLRVALQDEEEVAEVEVALATAVLRYAGDVRHGRIDPRSLGHSLQADPDPIDLPALADDLASAADPAARLAALEPRWPQYRALLAALAHEPRHGERIALALERWRWLPADPSGPAIVVNVPEYRLQALDPTPAGPAVALDMPVVVGRPDDEHRRTPLLSERVLHVVFSPIWDVPRRVAVRDLLPRFRQEAGFADRLGYYLEGPGGAEPVTLAGLERFEHGALALRQRPGPANALGGVAFMFPSAGDVYLHDTGDRALLARARRAHSSGCVRVGDAGALAAWVLRRNEGWGAARTLASMRRGQVAWLPVARAGQPEVHVTYATAVVGPDGGLLLLEDVYGEDERLRRALARRPDERPLVGAHQERGRPESRWTKS
jgi:murein L,D-transpeptidase YcbB/YkuD